MRVTWVYNFFTPKVTVICISLLLFTMKNVLCDECGFNPLRIYYSDIKMTKETQNRSPASFCPILKGSNMCCDIIEFQMLPTYIGNRYEEWVIALTDIYEMFEKWRSVYLSHTITNSNFRDLEPIITKRLGTLKEAIKDKRGMRNECLLQLLNHEATTTC